MSLSGKKSPMKKLSTAKRNQLVIVLFVTVIAIGGVYISLIRPQNLDNAKLARQVAAKKSDLDKMRDMIKQAVTTSNQLAVVSEQLNQAEGDVATGDVYVWTYNVLRQFKTAYAVDIPAIG